MACALECDEEDDWDGVRAQLIGQIAEAEGLIGQVAQFLVSQEIVLLEFEPEQGSIGLPITCARGTRLKDSVASHRAPGPAGARKTTHVIAMLQSAIVAHGPVAPAAAPGGGWIDSARNWVVETDAAGMLTLVADLLTRDGTWANGATIEFLEGARFDNDDGNFVFAGFDAPKVTTLSVGVYDSHTLSEEPDRLRFNSGATVNDMMDVLRVRFRITGEFSVHQPTQDSLRHVPPSGDLLSDLSTCPRIYVIRDASAVDLRNASASEPISVEYSGNGSNTTFWRCSFTFAEELTGLAYVYKPAKSPLVTLQGCSDTHSGVHVNKAIQASPHLTGASIVSTFAQMYRSGALTATYLSEMQYNGLIYLRFFNLTLKRPTNPSHVLILIFSTRSY